MWGNLIAATRLLEEPVDCLLPHFPLLNRHWSWENSVSWPTSPALFNIFVYWTFIERKVFTRSFAEESALPSHYFELRHPRRDGIGNCLSKRKPHVRFWKRQQRHGECCALCLAKDNWMLRWRYMMESAQAQPQGEQGSVAGWLLHRERLVAGEYKFLHDTFSSKWRNWGFQKPTKMTISLRASFVAIENICI